MRKMVFVHDVLRVLLATSGVAAMTYQLAVLHTRGTLVPGNFFSFFTIESNILAAAMLVVLAVVRRDERPHWLESVRGGVTLAIAITGVVFALLLSGHQEAVQTTIPWVDFVLHKLVPLGVVVDWFVERPAGRLSLRAAATWLLYPAAWFAYTIVRGASRHWYPYPFVDVGRHGYGGVFAIAALLLGCFAASAAGLALLTNRLAPLRPRP